MIDAHHHIWRQKDLPWLLGPEKPRIFGAYGPIRRDYPIDEFLADIARTGIEKSVYVQANWAPNWWADEIAWVDEVADRAGWPHAIVGYLDFTRADVRPSLEKVKHRQRLRGFRQQFHWHENPLYRFAPGPAQFDNDTVRSNIQRLAEYDWSFDLQVFAPQMQDAAKLAKACPDVTFILQHAGMLEDTSDQGWSLWRDGMKALADCENVVTKLSGLGTFVRRNDPELIRQIVSETLKLFGAKRCMFGSNYPIEKIWTPYGDIVEAYRTATTGLPKGQQKAVFNDTAARIYRLD
ncbi:MAG: amidohydrolase family protein [Pseudomonadota bacterium]